MQTLIKTSQELRQYTTASSGLDVAALLPFLRNSPAEVEVIRVLGRDLYMSILTKYNTTPSTLSAAETALLPYVQKPLANLALYHYVKQSGVIISSSGITLTTDREKQAYQWQQNKIENALVNTAYFALDSLIAYMFAHKADFEAWENSSEYRKSRSFFINTPAEFNRWVNIHNNYRTLVAMRPSMSQVEATLLKSILGDEFYKELKTEILSLGDPEGEELRFFIDENGFLIQEGEYSGTEFNVQGEGQMYVTFYNLTPENATLLTDFIQPTVAHLTIARAMQELNYEITADGAFIHTVNANNTANINQTSAPDQAQKEAFMRLHKEEGEAWAKRLADFLNKNASAETYATYYNSDKYVSPDAIAAGREIDTTLKIYVG